MNNYLAALNSSVNIPINPNYVFHITLGYILRPIPNSCLLEHQNLHKSLTLLFQQKFEILEIGKSIFPIFFLI